MAIKEEDKECICCYLTKPLHKTDDTERDSTPDGYSRASASETRKSSAAGSKAGKGKASEIRLCCCCGCCLIKLSALRVLEIIFMVVSVFAVAMNYAYIGIFTFFINSLARNVLAGAISCCLILYFGGATIMLIFRNSGVSRFRKISMLILFFCWIGYVTKRR